MKKTKYRLAWDLAKRCHRENIATYKLFNGELICNQMTYMVDGLIKCYHRNAVVFHSYVLKNNWFFQSIYLPNSFKITVNDVANQELLHCIEFRIGTGIIRKLENLFTTQKCEAVNMQSVHLCLKIPHIAEYKLVCKCAVCS